MSASQIGLLQAPSKRSSRTSLSLIAPAETLQRSYGRSNPFVAEVARFFLPPEISAWPHQLQARCIGARQARGRARRNRAIPEGRHSYSFPDRVMCGLTQSSLPLSRWFGGAPISSFAAILLRDCALRQRP